MRVLFRNGDQLTAHDRDGRDVERAVGGAADGVQPEYVAALDVRPFRAVARVDLDDRERGQAALVDAGAAREEGGAVLRPHQAAAQVQPSGQRLEGRSVEEAQRRLGGGVMPIRRHAEEGHPTAVGGDGPFHLPAIGVREEQERTARSGILRRNRPQRALSGAVFRDEQAGGGGRRRGPAGGGAFGRKDDPQHESEEGEEDDEGDDQAGPREVKAHPSPLPSPARPSRPRRRRGSRCVAASDRTDSSTAAMRVKAAAATGVIATGVRASRDGILPGTRRSERIARRRTASPARSRPLRPARR